MDSFHQVVLTLLFLDPKMMFGNDLYVKIIEHTEELYNFAFEREMYRVLQKQFLPND